MEVSKSMSRGPHLEMAKRNRPITKPTASCCSAQVAPAKLLQSLDAWRGCAGSYKTSQSHGCTKSRNQQIKHLEIAYVQ